MSLGGARGIVRVSENPNCEILPAMVIESATSRNGRRPRETDFYRLVMGREYPGEYGERESARRRGTKFERNQVQNYAALLRQAVAPLYGLDSNVMTVRNFLDEVPGASHAFRLKRTRHLLRDVANGRTVPDLLIQPQLRLRTGPDPQDYVYISPDFAVFDRVAQMYVPGEIKSFIVRGNVADIADLQRTRRQAAVEIAALRTEADQLGLGDRVENRAAFVFGTAFGLFPNTGHQEDLDGDVRAVMRAVRVIAKARTRLADLKATDGARFEVIVDDLEPNFQEKCVGTCVLVDYCKSRAADLARTLGDVAAEQLGADTSVDKLVVHLVGELPVEPGEAQFVTDLAEAIRDLGYDPRTFRKTA